MKLLATIRQGASEYDERLRTLLDASEIDPEEFVGLDYFGLVPFFVLSGASIRPEAHTHGEEVHVVEIHVEVPEELEEAFYATLPLILEDVYAEEDEEQDGPAAA